MMLDLQQLFVLGFLTSYLHWFLARSGIMHPLWSRARGKLDELLRCAGCSGFWLALGGAIAGLRPIHLGHAWIDVLVSALLGAWLTPVFEAVFMWGLSFVAIEDEHGNGEDEHRNENQKR